MTGADESGADEGRDGLPERRARDAPPSKASTG